MIFYADFYIESDTTSRVKLSENMLDKKESEPVSNNTPIAINKIPLALSIHPSRFFILLKNVKNLSIARADSKVKGQSLILQRCRIIPNYVLMTLIFTTS